MTQSAACRESGRHPAEETDRSDARMTVADRIACCRRIMRQGALIEAILGEAFRQNSTITMMLDIYACELEDRPAYLWQVCMATTVPVSTAYRRLEALHQSGLIERHVADRDHRRILLRVTPMGRDRINRLLDRFVEAHHPTRIGNSHDWMPALPSVEDIGPP